MTIAMPTPKPMPKRRQAQHAQHPHHVHTHTDTASYRRMLVRLRRFLLAHSYWYNVFTFPPRVFGAAAIMLWLLYTHHTAAALAIPWFFAGFLVYNLLSAPSTGQPNALDVLLARAVDAIYVWRRRATRGRLRRTSHGAHHTDSHDKSTAHDDPLKPPSRAAASRRSVSLCFSIRRVHIHLHHWLYLLLLYAATLVLHNGLAMFPALRVWWWHWSGELMHVSWTPDESFDMCAGFLLGGCVQGLKYTDWSHVLWVQSKHEQEHEHEQHEQQQHEQQPLTQSPLRAEDRSSSPRHRS